VWETLQRDYLSVERERRVFDVETHIPGDVDAFAPGYISTDDDVVVGLQTDVPLKRPMMPAGGWRMVETAIKEAGLEPDLRVKEIFTKYRKTHNEAVFDIYTPRIRAARSSHLLTGLPTPTAVDGSSATTAGCSLRHRPADRGQGHRHGFDRRRALQRKLGALPRGACRTDQGSEEAEESRRRIRLRLSVRPRTTSRPSNGPTSPIWPA